MTEVVKRKFLHNWNEESTFRLIETFREEPVLWDLRLKRYRHIDRATRQEAWERLAKNMGIDRVECERKMNSLLAQYRRERIRNSRIRAGLIIDTQRQWFGYRWFGFLAAMDAEREIDYRGYHPACKRGAIREEQFLDPNYNDEMDGDTDYYYERDYEHEEIRPGERIKAEDEADQMLSMIVPEVIVKEEGEFEDSIVMQNGLDNGAKPAENGCSHAASTQSFASGNLTVRSYYRPMQSKPSSSAAAGSASFTLSRQPQIEIARANGKGCENQENVKPNIAQQAQTFQILMPGANSQQAKPAQARPARQRQDTNGARVAKPQRDECDVFAQYIIGKLAKLSPKVRSNARAEINRIINAAH